MSPNFASLSIQLSQLIVFHEHLTHLHFGPQLLLSILRRRCWITRARTLINTVLHKCFTCTRLCAEIPIQTMGILSSKRVVPGDRALAY